MPNPDTAAPTAGRAGPPWDAGGTVRFHGGPLSNFAPTPGLRLPFGYHGHHENDRVPVRTVEHWYQACKATSRQQFDLILACGTAAAARHAGRETDLRPDWEQVKPEVMLCGLRGKFALEPYRSALLLTQPRPLAEDSPSDFVWGCRDPQGGYGCTSSDAVGAMAHLRDITRCRPHVDCCEQRSRRLGGRAAEMAALMEDPRCADQQRSQSPPQQS